MNFYAINGSPRRKGNTAEVLKKALECTAYSPPQRQNLFICTSLISPDAAAALPASEKAEPHTATAPCGTA